MNSSKKVWVFVFFLFASLLIYFSSCRWNTVEMDNGYPKPIADIITTKCSTTGCHTTHDKLAAGGLALDSWDHLFQGGSGGSVVIPYRADQSWLCYFINTYSDLGIQLHPTMPQNGAPLSHDDVRTIYDWVANGAPNNKGDIAFSGADRKKFYVVNQGCDLVTVFDEQTKLAMRDIDVGAEPNAIESPHAIRVSPDGKYWYVVFYQGKVIQKFDAGDDHLVSECELETGEYSNLLINGDGTLAWVVDWSGNGKIVPVDLETMKREDETSFAYIHGIAADKNYQMLYLTAEHGNCVHKIPVLDPTDNTDISLDPPNAPNNDGDVLIPHDIIFSPDYSKYYVSCQGTNEVRVMNSSNDSLLKIIPVGAWPQELARSESKPYLFVTCMEDPCDAPVCMGSVCVINCQTDEVVKIINESFYQPHGIAVDDFNGLVYVANQNIDTIGPPPHHISTCGGRNGFVRIIDMNTLQLIDYKAEVSVDPYQVAVKN